MCMCYFKYSRSSASASQYSLLWVEGTAPRSLPIINVNEGLFLSKKWQFACQLWRFFKCAISPVDIPFGT